MPAAGRSSTCRLGNRVVQPQAGPAAFDGKAFVKTLPGSPGVYRMLDACGNALYVGKAARLDKRVASYFLRPRLEPRLMAMLAQVVQVEVTLTRTEAEALLLENELIKSLRPRYNILLRDDKSYPQLFLSEGEDYPRMAFHRGPRHARGRYFGPFPSAYAVRESLNTLQKVFRIRPCEDSYFRTRSRPCLQHQIGRCTAPCVRLVTPEAYAQDVRHATMFLEGQSTAVIDELIRDMDQASQELAFERAAYFRDQIANLKKIQARQFVSDIEKDTDVLACAASGEMVCVHAMFFRNGTSVGGRNFFPDTQGSTHVPAILEAFISQYYLEQAAPPIILVPEPIPDRANLEAALSARRGGRVQIVHVQRGERQQLIAHALRDAEQALVSESLKQTNLQKRWRALEAWFQAEGTFKRIECFDISHTQGEATVAACVAFDPNGPAKSQYRRYHITGVAPGDDYAAMHQALSRRFRRALQEDSELPDLLLVDGGRGQLAQAVAALSELGITGVRLMGVAKGMGRKPGLEELVIGPEAKPLRPQATDPGFHLVQQIRDEAHRFAIGGHRLQRQKRRQTSRLEEIPGVGAKRRAALLKHFGGLTGVMGAGVEELVRVKGIDRGLAQRIYNALHGIG